MDDEQTHRDAQPSIKDAATLRANAWPTNNAATTFAGTFEPNAVLCEAQYDWNEAYDYLS